MLVSISSGRTEAPLELVDLLLECHTRIRSFVALAKQAGLRQDAPFDQVEDACASVERYFSEALPLHVADEEQSILPRLRGKNAQIDRALGSMCAQHQEHGAGLADLLRRAAAVRAAPGDESLRGPLVSAATALEREFSEHLALEESVLFPALRQLDTETREAIVQELRGRRVSSFTSPAKLVHQQVGRHTP